MQLQDFMTRNPHATQAEDSVQRAAEQMRRHNIGALPGFQHDRLVGIITDRDLLSGCMAAGHSAADCAVKQRMTADPDPVTSDPSASIEEALAKMANEQVLPSRRSCDSRRP
jgi:CBS domain-containing protein